VTDRTRVARNVAIVVALAAAIEFLPGGGRAATTISAILGVGFGAGIALFAYRMYLEHRATVHGLSDRDRGLLYAAAATSVVLAAAQPRMWDTGAGELAWFVLAGAVVAVLVAVYRRWRAY
jgi:uncharacterized membrane protein (UPF0136 family)